MLASVGIRIGIDIRICKEHYALRMMHHPNWTNYPTASDTISNGNDGSKHCIYCGVGVGVGGENEM